MSRIHRTKPISTGNIVGVPVPSPCFARIVERVKRELEQEHESRAARVREALKGAAAGGSVECGYAIEM